MYTTFLVKVNGSRYPTAQRASFSPTVIVIIIDRPISCMSTFKCEYECLVVAFECAFECFEFAFDYFSDNVHICTFFGFRQLALHGVSNSPCLVRHVSLKTSYKKIYADNMASQHGLQANVNVCSLLNPILLSQIIV